MNVQISDMKFPVLAFSGNMFFIRKNEERLTRCGVEAFRKNFHRNMIIIDSDCDKYLVNNAEKIGYHGSFWGFSLLYKRRIRVKLHFNNEIVKLSLEKIKEMICQYIGKKPDFWYSAGSIKDLKTEVMKAETFDELIHLPFLR